MQEKFLLLYDSKIDEVFLYSLKATSDRELAKAITQSTFKKVWDFMKEGHSADEARLKLMKFAAELVKREKGLHHIHTSQFMPTLKMS